MSDLTFPAVKLELRAIGITAKKTEYGEFRLSLLGSSDEEHAYYTTDLEDALGTGRAMAEERDRNLGLNGDANLMKPAKSVRPSRAL